MYHWPRKRSKFKVQVLLNAYFFCTIIRSKSRKSNHCQLRTVCIDRSRGGVKWQLRDAEAGEKSVGKVWTPQAEREGERVVLSGSMLERPQQELQDGGSQSYAEDWESFWSRKRVGQRTQSSLLPLPITLSFPLAWLIWYNSAKELGWSSPEWANLSRQGQDKEQWKWMQRGGASEQ